MKRVPGWFPVIVWSVIGWWPAVGGEARPGEARPGEARPGEARPNVILIMADDLGYHDLGCFGHPVIETPHLDRMARGGAKLTNFHAGASVCAPSRMSLLTGAYAVRLGWERGVPGYMMGPRDGMSPEALTIGEIFRRAGYATGIAGKWHVGNLPETRPHAQGFDWTYVNPMSNNQMRKIYSGDEVVEKNVAQGLWTEKFTRKAIEFIRTDREQPFFLYLPYTAPHFPLVAHPDWEGRSAFGVYGDVVEEMDFRIGEILAALEEEGMRRQTVVVFCSDNGPQRREPSRAHPFRGQKWGVLEGSSRVPCIISLPGTIPAGREVDELISAMDWLPTLSRACGIDWEEASGDEPVIDGVDVWPTLLGLPGEHPRRELLHWQGLRGELGAIQSDGWKLVFRRADALVGEGAEGATERQRDRLKPYLEGFDPDESNPPFLVRLTDDPGELEDLSAEYPGKVAELTRRAGELLAEIEEDGILRLATPDR